MDIDRLWKNTQEELKIILAPAVFQTFVSKTQLLALQNNIATIACPNTYLVEINHKRYYQIFKNALDNQTKGNNTLKFILQDLVKTEPIENSSRSPLFTYAPSKNVYFSNLNSKYTFDTLVVGNSNNFAYAAAQGIVKNPGLSYNPFFIWGGVGVGKTHLMQAIGHQLLKNYSDYKIKYLPAETFANELISALKSKNMNQFKDKYRQLDCILVDDIQFLAGKEYIQEEFFHTFNSLHLAGRQIILTSDRKPEQIQGLEDRLVSRFMGGLTVDIQLPDYEMRVAIIRQKTEEKKISISSEAINFIANSIQSNIRDIEGQLQQIALKSQSDKVGEVGLSFIQNYFSPPENSNLKSENQNLNPRHIISLCAKHFGIKTSDLCGSNRQKELVAARHLTAYLLLTEINLPLKEVGSLLGGRDHTSIMHARDKIQSELSTNPQLRTVINQIKNSF